MPGRWMEGQAYERVGRYIGTCRMVGRKVNVCNWVDPTRYGGHEMF